MKYVGVDLHKKVVSICVVVQEAGRSKVSARRRFAYSGTVFRESFFRGLGPFQVVVEASSCHDWLADLVDPMADRQVLTHPKKLRVIAESARTTDKVDAQVLAALLALDMIPESYRPSPRVREHRRLVRHRVYVVRKAAAIKTRLRRILASYNADVKYLFTEKGREYLSVWPRPTESSTTSLERHPSPNGKPGRYSRVFLVSAR